MPKTGGTSISAALAEAGKISFDEPVKTNRHKFNPRHACRGELEKHLAGLDIDFTFLIVRHPVDRIISEFRYQRRKSGLHISKSLNFQLWLHYSLKRTEHWRGYRDNHFRPQTEFAVPCCQIFRFEDGIEAPINSINQQLGLSLKLPPTRKNVSPKIQVKPTESDISKIVAFYAADFDAYDYQLSKYKG